jgi:hypothetical protein
LYVIIFDAFIVVLIVRQSISPLCVEVAGLAELPSTLALAFATIILPTTFAEVIGLKLRRPNNARPYLYPQIWAGIMYMVATVQMLALWLVLWKKKRTTNTKVSNGRVHAKV